MEDYDAVVVGAGNGGLTCAVSLAQMGLDTLLLERHNIPGGCATSFRRGRFEFEVALHQLSGMGTEEKPGPLRRLLGSLGVMDDLILQYRWRRRGDSSGLNSRLSSDCGASRSMTSFLSTRIAAAPTDDLLPQMVL